MVERAILTYILLGRQTNLFKYLFSWIFFSSHPYRIRIAGIRGIQGVVRKTVNDELRATIWEPQHMDKIVPSLLFNMQKIEEVDRYCIKILKLGMERWLSS